MKIKWQTNKSAKFISFLLTIFVGLYILLSFAAIFSPLKSICCDAISWVAPADAQVMGYGKPYVDFWDIKPPGLIAISSLWIQIFGSSLLGFKILNFLIGLGVFTAMWFVYEKLFSWRLARPLVILTALPLYSVAIQTQFYSSEMLGLLFSIVGLSLLLSKFSISKKRLFFGSFLLAFAGQIKDPYLPAILATLPFFFYSVKKNRKVSTQLIIVALGILASIVVTTLYLALSGSLGEYLQVIADKNQEFSVLETQEYIPYLLEYLQLAADTFIQASYFFVLPVFISVAAKLLQWWRAKKIQVSSNKNSKALKFSIGLSKHHHYIFITLCYILGSFIGFSMQGKTGFHYYIQIVIPLFLLLFLSIENLRQILLSTTSSIPKNWIKKVLFFSSFLLFIFVVPKKEYLKEFLNFERPIQAVANFMSIEEGDMESFAYVQSRTNPGDCVFSVYGWTTGQFYFYTKRKPCSQYFLVNILDYDQKKELAAQLIQNPPKAIRYTQSGSDLDVDQFETEVVNFTQVLEHCYVVDERYSYLYFPIFDNGQLSSCVAKYM